MLLAFKAYFSQTGQWLTSRQKIRIIVSRVCLWAILCNVTWGAYHYLYWLYTLPCYYPILDSAIVVPLILALQSGIPLQPWQQKGRVSCKCSTNSCHAHTSSKCTNEMNTGHIEIYSCLLRQSKIATFVCMESIMAMLLYCGPWLASSSPGHSTLKTWEWPGDEARPWLLGSRRNLKFSKV